MRQQHGKPFELRIDMYASHVLRMHVCVPKGRVHGEVVARDQQHCLPIVWMPQCTT